MRAEDLCVRYDDKIVLDHFSADFGGGITCLVGPSGFGKTTLLHVIAGLVIPESGRITGRPDKVTLMFQDDRLFPWMTALENVRIVCDDAQKAAYWLQAVELGSEADTYPAELSGGMRRRVALARALAFGGDLLLLDEPFKGMDLPLVQRLAPLIKDLHIPVIVSTHSPEEQEILGGTVLEMDKL